MNFDYTIEYRSTKDFGNADGLSRLPCRESGVDDPGEQEIYQIQQETIASLPITAKSIATNTEDDLLLRRVKNLVEKGWPEKVDEDLRQFFVARNNLSLVEGCLLMGTRTVIPAKLRPDILQIIHTAHPGIVRMKALARQKVWWPRIDQDIEQIRKECAICQKTGPEERKIPLHPWETPERPWQRIHVDFCGPFLGNMWFIMVDAKTKWPEAIKMKNTDARTTIEKMRKIFSTHGLPEQIVSDNGPQFTSEEWREYCESRGIVHTLTPPYHPQSNGEAERYVQSFKQAMLRQKEGGVKPEVAMYQVLGTYRITPHSATGLSPAEMMFGRRTRSLLDVVKPVVAIETDQREDRKKMEQYREWIKKNFDRRTRERIFDEGEPVFARNYRDGPKWIQGKVIKRMGQTLYLVRTWRGIWRRHADQLKVDRTQVEVSDSEEELESNPEPPEEWHDPPENPVKEPPVEHPVVVPPKAVVELRRSARVPKPTKMFDPS